MAIRRIGTASSYANNEFAIIARKNINFQVSFNFHDIAIRMYKPVCGL